MKQLIAENAAVFLSSVVVRLLEFSASLKNLIMKKKSQNVNNKMWIKFLIPDPYFQPISNADFIVPVEIDGTVHQVCETSPH